MRRRRCDKLPLLLLGAAVAFAVGAVFWTGDWSGRTSSRRPANWRTLADLNNEMIRAHGRGDWTNAARIAGRILSQPEWRTFIPANAVMGSMLARERQYQAAEAFFKAALSGKGVAAPAPVVMNDYADTLRHLGRYAETETFARRAIAASGGRVALYKLTLEEILRDAKDNSKTQDLKKEKS